MTMPPPRRILMTTDAVGGVWTYATDLARGLGKSGNEVVLVVMGPAPRPDQLGSVRRARGVKVELTELSLEWMDPEGHDIARARDSM